MHKKKNSLVVSIIIHISIIFTLIYLWQKFIAKKDINEKRICVKLSILKTTCKIEEEIIKEIEKQEIIKKTEPKIIKPKIIKKKKEKEKEIIKPKIVPVIQEEKIEKEIVPKQVRQVPKQVRQEPKQQTQEKYIELNIEELKQLLQENLYYPRSARKRGIEGSVMVKLTLDTDASISNIVILHSKSEILSRAAIKTLKKLSKKVPKPKEKLVLKIPINYCLQN